MALRFEPSRFIVLTEFIILKRVDTRLRVPCIVLTDKLAAYWARNSNRGFDNYPAVYSEKVESMQYRVVQGGNAQ